MHIGGQGLATRVKCAATLKMPLQLMTERLA